MSRFVPEGPFPIERNGRTVDRTRLSDFWSDVEDSCLGLSDAVGCYIFAIRAGKGVRPWYVGKTEKASFSREVFQPHKLVLYAEALNEVDKGTPLIYFLPKVTSGGKFSKPSLNGVPSIAALEELLIATCLQRNTVLLNKRTTKHLREMEVPGYMNERPGNRSNGAVKLSEVLGSAKNLRSRKKALRD